jgi:hypothetical protein
METPAEIQFPFLGLAGELRNLVYAHVVHDLDPIRQVYQLEEKCTLPKKALALGHVNKQLREEYLSFLFANIGFMITWPKMTMPITQQLLATGDTGAQPRGLAIFVGAQDEYSRVDLLTLVWLSRRDGVGATAHVNADKTGADFKRRELFSGRVEGLIGSLTACDVPFRPSKVGGLTSFGAFTHVYIDQGVEPTLGPEWKLDVLIVLEQSYKALSKDEWHVLIKIYSALWRLPGAKVKVEERADGTVRRYTCENQKGLCLVPVGEEAEQ